MELEDLTKMVNIHIDGIANRLIVIENNSEKLKNWITIRRRANQNAVLSDEAILKEMVKLFGQGCLNALIREVANDFIKDCEDKITAHSCDLKMIVAPIK